MSDEKKFNIKYDEIFEHSFTAISKKLFSQNRDMPIVITGKVGSGKTVLGIETGILVCHANSKSFDLLKNMIYYPDYNQIQQAIMEEDDYKPIVIDEAIRSVYKMNALTSDSTKLKILLDICRKRKKVLIFCLPKIQDFSSLMIDRIAIWLHIVYRGDNKGICAVFIPSGNFLEKTQWDLNQMSTIYDKKILKNSDKIPIYDSVNKVYDDFKKFPNFVFAFEFYDLPKNLYKEYERISWDLLKDLQESEEIKTTESLSVQKAKNRMMISTGNLFYKDHKSYEEIKSLLDISDSLLNKYLELYRQKENITLEQHQEEIKTRNKKSSKKAWQTRRLKKESI